MTLTINPALGAVSNPCEKTLSNIDIAPHSSTCDLTFDTAKKKWNDNPANNGTLLIAKKEDPSSYCIYNYDYTYKLVPYSYFNLHSENISLASCHGNLTPSEISVINDKIEALSRPIVGNLLLNVDDEKAAKSTESFSNADCNGSNNCIIASPDGNTLYVPNGSTLLQSITLQNELDRYEPLNFAQFLGSHNSAASRRYTSSTADYNMSYSDPDSYLTLTDQLNSGVRQLELDVVWYNNAITLCHNHFSAKLEGVLCDDNAPITTALTEIKSWIEKNPRAVLILYLDVNLPLTGKVNELDHDLSELEPYIFTPKMAEPYGVSNNTLPALQLSQNTLTEKLKKNIIITNDNDIDNLKNSQYVFVNVEQSTETPLYEVSVNNFLQSTISCDSNKYDKIKTLYGADPNHYNILRMNGDRTTVNYVQTVGNKKPSEFIDYYTTLNFYDIRNCPINIFSENMLGYTCDSNACNAHPTDPRFYSFLWSWELGYPLQSSGSELAYINSKTGHFENNPLIPDNIYTVLCYKPDASQKAPTKPLSWYVQNIKITDVHTAAAMADTACKTSGGLFSVPTTAYWMNDVINTLPLNHTDNVLVNYQDVNHEWMPNVFAEKKEGKTVLIGQSLIK